MKQLTTAMTALLEKETINLCWIFRVVREDGVQLGFTSHDRDLVIDGITYEAHGAMMPSTLESSADAAVNNLSTDGVIQSDLITVKDIAAGRYDGAKVVIAQVDWKHPNAGQILWGVFDMDKITYRNGSYKADMLSGKNAIQRINGKLVSERCDVLDFGDHKCKYDVAALDVVTTVAAGTVDGSSIHTAAADAPYAYGWLKIIGGEWDGITREIKSFSGGVAVLWNPLPAVPALGQQIRLRQGCNRLKSRCKELGNILNFRGYPSVPGIDQVSKTPDVKS
jgi:uncharacterized phage protein (TIGR02218 family)